MYNKANIITTKILAGVLALALAPAVFAHGGFDHVIGTVVQVSNNVLTVKTTKGNVDVKLDDKTEISKGDQKALKADLKPGLRVIVDIPEGSKDQIAHSVKVGAAAAAAHADHDAH
jgi:hypothetical protein